MKKYLLVVLLALLVMPNLTFAVDAEGCVKLGTTLKAGSTDSYAGGPVEKVQRFLESIGLLDTDGDYGTYGKKTVKAVMSFQKKYGLEQVGTVGPMTRLKIAEISGCSTAEQIESASSNNKSITFVDPDHNVSWEKGIKHSVTVSAEKMKGQEVSLRLRNKTTDIRYALKVFKLKDGDNTTSFIVPTNAATGTYDLIIGTWLGNGYSEKTISDFTITLLSQGAGESEDQADASDATVDDTLSIVRPVEESTYKLKDQINLKWDSEEKYDYYGVSVKNLDTGKNLTVGSNIKSKSFSFVPNKKGVVGGNYAVVVHAYKNNKRANASVEPIHIAVNDLPKISNVSPTQVVPGHTMTISGVNFTSADNAVYIDGVQVATTTSPNGKVINATLPGSVSEERVKVRIMNENGFSNEYVVKVKLTASVDEGEAAVQKNVTVVAPSKSVTKGTNQTAAVSWNTDIKYNNSNVNITLQKVGSSDFYAVKTGVANDGSGSISGIDLVNAKVPAGSYNFRIAIKNAAGDKFVGVSEGVIVVVSQNPVDPATDSPAPAEKYVNVEAQSSTIIKNTTQSVSMTWDTNITYNNSNVNITVMDVSDNTKIYAVKSGVANDGKGSITGKELYSAGIPVGNYKIRVAIKNAAGDKTVGTSSSVLSVVAQNTAATRSETITTVTPVVNPDGTTTQTTTTTTNTTNNLQQPGSQTPAAKYVTLVAPTKSITKGTNQTASLTWNTNITYNNSNVNITLVDVNDGTKIYAVKSGVANDGKGSITGTELASAGIPKGSYTYRIVVKDAAGAKHVGTSSSILTVLPAGSNSASAIQSIVDQLLQLLDR